MFPSVSESHFALTVKKAILEVPDVQRAIKPRVRPLAFIFVLPKGATVYVSTGLF
jgi:hypothetical protein